MFKLIVRCSTHIWFTLKYNKQGDDMFVDWGKSREEPDVFGWGLSGYKSSITSSHKWDLMDHLMRLDRPFNVCHVILL